MFARAIISIDSVLCRVDECQVPVMLRIVGLHALENIWPTYSNVTLPPLSRTECYVSSHVHVVVTSAISSILPRWNKQPVALLLYITPFILRALIHVLNVQCGWVCIQYGWSLAVRHVTQNQSVLRYDTVTVGREVVNFSLTPPHPPPARMSDYRNWSSKTFVYERSNV